MVNQLVASLCVVLQLTLLLEVKSISVVMLLYLLMPDKIAPNHNWRVAFNASIRVTLYNQVSAWCVSTRACVCICRLDMVIVFIILSILSLALPTNTTSTLELVHMQG